MQKISCTLIQSDKDRLHTLFNIIQGSALFEVECFAFSSGKEGLKHLKSKQTDLLILDVQLTDIDGFEIIEYVNPKTTKTIITSDKEYYAIQAVKMEVFDYILTPFKEIKIIESLNRYKEYRDNSLALNNLPSNLIAVNTMDKLLIVNINDIVRLQGNGAYTTFYLNDTMFIASRNLSYFESILQQGMFFRIHKSHIINLEKLKYIEKDGAEGVCVLSDNSRIMLSALKKRDLYKKLLGKGQDI